MAISIGSLGGSIDGISLGVVVESGVGEGFRLGKGGSGKSESSWKSGNKLSDGRGVVGRDGAVDGNSRAGTTVRVESGGPCALGAGRE